ncbi:hypothetical protein LPJ56_006540, partial [Coemansia sp. RSA 2599]
FSSERILSVVQNLLSSISSTKRSEYSISNAVSLHYNTVQKPSGPRSANSHISIFEQEAFLKAVVCQVKSGNAKGIIDSLNQIRDALIHAEKGFLAISTPIGKSAQSYVDEYSRQWFACYEKYAENRGSEANGKSSNSVSGLSESAGKHPAFGKGGVFPIEYAKRSPDLEQPIQVHFPLASLQSSCVIMKMKNHTFCAPTGKLSFEEELQSLPALEYYAIYILAELIGRTDGFLYNAIRGKGFAYGAFIHPSLWTGQLTFVCYRASDAARAILAMRQLLHDIDVNWDRYINDFEISAARSSIVYSNSSKMCTPINIVDHCISSNVYGFESASQYNRWRNVHFAAVGKKELRQAFDKYVKSFADPNYPLVTVFTSPPEAELLPEIGEFERKTLESISEQYK